LITFQNNRGRVPHSLRCWQVATGGFREASRPMWKSRGRPSIQMLKSHL
ncbi:hypothetical protein LINGRAHAP2_LOCUS33279, partial [Linum grandiflorum]